MLILPGQAFYWDGRRGMGVRTPPPTEEGGGQWSGVSPPPLELLRKENEKRYLGKKNGMKRDFFKRKFFIAA